MFLPALVVEVAGSLGAWQRGRPASGTGVIMLCGQKVALSRAHAGQTLTIAVSTPPWPRRPGGRTGLKSRLDGGLRAVSDLRYRYRCADTAGAVSICAWGLSS